VEFALVLPLLLALLFGIIECGFLFKDQLGVQACAREGARSAAVGKTLTEVNARITGAASYITTTSLTSTLSSRYYNSGAWTTWVTLGNNSDGTMNDAPQGGQVRVQCNYTHALLTGPLFANLIGRSGATTMTLHATMVMRRE
jgi:Flp pilus assembly protein TadG